MSKDAKQSLGVNDDDGKQTGSKRKMTSAILEDQSKEDEVYEFLEEDDDFEEFDIGGADEDMYAAAGQADVEMQSITLQKRDSVSNFVEKDNNLQWKADWDDDDDDEDFAAKLRAQLSA